jgi:hypothetical protein
MKNNSAARLTIGAGIGVLVLFAMASITNALDVNAGSCSYADIQSAAEQVQSAGGGTVYIPAGDCTHTDIIRMSDGISLIGAGQGATIIRNGDIRANTAFYGKLNKGFRISGFSLLANSGQTAYLEIRDCHDFRIDHITINMVRSGSGIEITSSRSGVIDHCEITVNTSLYGIAIGGTDSSYPSCWPSLNFIAGASSAIFIEDNVFLGTYQHAIVGHGAAHYVARHNSFAGTPNGHPVDAHGPGFGPPCGTRLVEIYDNSFANSNPVSENWKAIEIRGGSGLIFNNNFPSWDNAVMFTLDAWHDLISYGGNCNNPLSGGYPCNMQVKDVWIWNNTYSYLGGGSCNCGFPSAPHCCQSIVWDNTGLHYNINDMVKAERDYNNRAPTQAQDGFIYTPYRYPHPLISNVGAPNPPVNITVEKVP